MATQSLIAAARDTRHDGFGPTSFPHRPHPGSPTLTNPDMILPDYDESEPLQDLSQSRSTMWESAQPSNVFHNFSSTGYVAGPLSPSTPIIYGNGTMLSDIGEVTEVESTVGYESSGNSSRLSGPHSGTGSSGTPLRSSPTVGFKKSLKSRPHMADRERRLSIESTSTIHITEVSDGTYGDFGDAVSVDDSSFHGDDEESNASEFVGGKSTGTRSASVLSSGQAPSEHSSSTNSISKRAEEILANAKRRLTAMEGNLHRARGFSYSSVPDGSALSRGSGRPNELSRDRVRSIGPSHSRNVSDNDVQVAGQTHMLPQRSASALGAAGGYRQQLPLSRSADALWAKGSLGCLRPQMYSIDTILEPLEEDEDVDGEMQSRPGGRPQRFTSPTLGSFADAGTTRAASAAQMRDLHDQMQGLKGKISSLREQAKQDSMKRRSMQNSRALSPFTNAAHDAALPSPKSTRAREAGSPFPDYAPNGTDSRSEKQTRDIQGGKQEQPCIDDEEHTDVTADGFHDEAGDEQLPRLAEEEDDDSRSRNSAYQETPRQSSNGTFHVDETPSASHTDNEETEYVLQDDVSEGEESLYHDTHQEQGDISHEDREDAFDYEHFFLHSAMGTISRQGMTRSDSFSSEGSNDSVETTRGLAPSRAQRSSLATMTSVDSFATAREYSMGSRNSTAQSHRPGDGSATPTTPPPQHEASDDVPARGRRSTFGESSCKAGGRSGSRNGSDLGGYAQQRARPSSVLYRPFRPSTDTLHRPSASSFESIGTNRSFPLVNKTRPSGGVLTPNGSPDPKIKQAAESLMNETCSMGDEDSAGSGTHSPAIQTLSRQDQVLVEQIVASLGRCVLGLAEAARHGTGNHDQYRQRIEAARELLEDASD